MKRIIASILAFAAISCNGQEKQFSEESLSKKLLSIDGKSKIPFEEILENHEGKIVVIEIWASWCSDCVKAMPLMNELQKNNSDVDFVFISMDKTTEKWLEGIKKHELNGEHYLATDGMKGEFGSSMNVDWIPRYIVVNKTGKVVLFRAVETDFEKINIVINEVRTKVNKD